MSSSDSDNDIETVENVILNKNISTATVRFEEYEKNRFYYVKINDIKMKVMNESNQPVRVPFEPKHDKDFQVDILYLVKWLCPTDCSENHPKHYDYYKARIINLGCDVQDCQAKTNEKRCHFRKNVSALSGTTLSSDDLQTQQSFTESLDLKKLEKRAQQIAGARIVKKNITMDQFLSKRKYLNSITNNLEKKQLLKSQNSMKPRSGITKPVIRSTIEIDDQFLQHTSSTAINPFSSNDKEKAPFEGNDSPITTNKSVQETHEQQDKENFMAAYNIMRSEYSHEKNDFSRKENPSETPFLQHEFQEDPNRIADHNQGQSELSEGADNCSTGVSGSKSVHSYRNDGLPNTYSPTAICMSHRRRPQKVQYALPPEKINVNPHGQIYETVNDGNQVYLGLDIYVDMDVWEKMLRNKKRPTIFLRELAEVIWTPTELVMRAFDVKSCSATTPGIEGSRKPFEEDKWQLLIKLYTKYLTDLNKENSKVDVSAYLGKVTDVIKQKIQDLRATLRRNEEKQKFNIVRTKQKSKKAIKYIDHHNE